MKLFFLTLPLILIVGLAGYFLLAKPTAVHYHAGFVVYINGTKQDYSALQYMNLENCSLHSKPKDAAALQEEKAHLHDNVGDVVHVHVKGATWADLFRNIGVKFPGGPVYGYRNGQEVADILHQEIKPYDSVIIMVGKKVPAGASGYVTKAHIRAVEKSSENCGS